MLRRRVAIAFAVGMTLCGMLIPAFLAEQSRKQPIPVTITPDATYPERPTITVWFPPGDLHKPSEGLSEPRKDRP